VADSKYAPEKAIWQEQPAMLKEGAGWWTAVGIVTMGQETFVRVARGRAQPARDETNAPVAQAQKLNFKSRARWNELKAAVDAMFDRLEGIHQDDTSSS
jgi:hypothetical protein